jgi:hypothetical protein
VKNAILKWIPLLVLLVPMQAWAAPITYDIVFNAPSSGNAPTAAEFTYDADTATLTDLSVIWEGITFDNFFFSGSRCGTGDAGTFALLMRTCSAGGSYSWDAIADGVGAAFRMRYVEGLSDELLQTAGANRLDVKDKMAEVVLQRGWISTPRATSVPEPSALALLGLGVAGSGFARWRRKATRV